MFRSLVFAAALAACSVAHASPLESARRHFQAIAANDVAALSAGYHDDAILEWIGGPLDGRYVGRDAIRAVWEKFAGANGKLEVLVARADEQMNPRGATVVADARYRGKAQLKIRHAVTLRDGRISFEIWQIAPDMKFE